MSAFDSLKKFIGIEEVEEEGFTEDEVQAAKDKMVREGTRDSSFSAPTSRKAPAEFSKPSEAAKAVPIERRISVASTNAFKLVLIASSPSCAPTTLERSSSSSN